METTIFNFEEKICHFENTEGLKSKLDYMDARSIVTSLRRTKDPILMTFEHIDNRHLDKLAKDFVKDNLMTTISFISKVI